MLIVKYLVPQGVSLKGYEIPSVCYTEAALLKDWFECRLQTTGNWRFSVFILA